MGGLGRATALAGALLVAAAESPGLARGQEREAAVAAGPSAHRTATGTMTACDAEGRELTVRSATGSTVFRVAADARVWLGRKALPLRDLHAHIGAQVTVAWAEVDGVRTTHTVRLEPARAGHH